MSSYLLSLVLTRLKLITNTQTDVELARVLQVSPQTLSSWKVRNSIPYPLCVEFARSHTCSLDWLLLGEGSQHRMQAQVSDWEAELLEQLRGLPVQDRQAILLHVQDKQRIHQLEEQVQDLAARLAANTG